MSESEEVVEIQGAEKYTLVDCITDPALDWVAPEPRGIASALTPKDPRLCTTVEQRRANEPQHWSVRLPGEEERVCSSFAGHDFAMIFKIQRKPTKEVGRAPRQNWVSLKHHEDVKLFKMFVDSVKDFKERYYIVRPESPSVRESLMELEEDRDEQGVARKDASRQVIVRSVPKFPLGWSYTHFLKEPKEYTTGDADLSPEDMAAFESLKAFVAGFTPGVWTTRKGVTIRDEHGEPKASPRFINTRTLLKCKNAGEVKLCLDEMESIAERMLKAKQDEKASRSGRGKKKMVARASQEVRPGTPSVQVIGTSVGGSGTPTSAPRPPPAKRTREEDSPVEEAGMGACSKFLVPRCFTVDRFFEKYPPEVFEAERTAILNQEPEVRKEQHARDMAAVVRMVSSSLVLGDERESLVEQLNTAQARNERAKGRINQLKIVVDDLKEKQKRWGDQLDEHLYLSSQPEPPIASWVLGRGTGTMGSFRELSSSSRSSISLMVN
ncbi:unnamed protein product [Trifolium pratense]|uniref:Uncharacterized protein n=1 Tax=Trifolium pratense TaxID=57577 RepID=A0ACB0JDK2_TRIPR|nr:unnamed protein product [Trifolium pratense]